MQPWVDRMETMPNESSEQAQEPLAPAKHIIPLCDGPRNRAAKVWRIFESLDLINVGQVVAFYDGVGSSSFKPLALLGGAFSWRPSPTTSTLGKGKAVGMLER